MDKTEKIKLGSCVAKAYGSGKERRAQNRFVRFERRYYRVSNAILKIFLLIIRECYYPLIIGENQKNFLVKRQYVQTIRRIHTGWLYPRCPEEWLPQLHFLGSQNFVITACR